VLSIFTLSGGEEAEEATREKVGEEVKGLDAELLLLLPEVELEAEAEAEAEVDLNEGGLDRRRFLRPVGQYGAARQSAQRGRCEVHTVCPRPTSSLLMGRQRSRGSHASSCARVSSGFLALRVQPSRPLMRCT